MRIFVATKEGMEKGDYCDCKEGEIIHPCGLGFDTHKTTTTAKCIEKDITVSELESLCKTSEESLVGQVDLDMVKKEVETIRYLGKMFKVGDIVRVKDKSYRKIKKVLTLDELVANLKKLKTDKEIDSYLISLDFSPNPSGEMLTRYSRDIIVNKKEEMVRVDVNNYHSSWEIIKEVTLAKGKHKWDIS